MSEAKLTAVLVTYRKNRLNHRLIFGTPAFEVRRGWHRKFAVFSPGNIFAYERWRGDKYGTQDWSLVVCETLGTGAFTQIPGVMPGAQLFLHARGKTKIRRALQCFDVLKQGRPRLETVPVSVWRDLHHKLCAGQNEAQILDHLEQVYPC